ncbi:uncharacterized protein PHALS_07613 [Plasmopara halstedii]|uniref:Uncharacterized protein n=1 Tax=Plasmopara halstedii TaxID=4781 RepID=A0A0N7L8H3_PLAHL|nr:uncharacterized protein PHALS_07613 [Plasmopara halstedii]CEG49875.1 hypothetical protein PHALS_07613 [Plasmopara halstedii]|eukprot:XP_024586244.1 hypothetical protein PHALS_07613 [Plasmopara halstedii]
MGVRPENTFVSVLNIFTSRREDLLEMSSAGATRKCAHSIRAIQTHRQESTKAGEKQSLPWLPNVANHLTLTLVVEHTTQRLLWLEAHADVNGELD